MGAHLLLSFALLVSVVAASSPWKPGTEYEYEYKTRTIVGIPELKDQISGTGIRARVIFQVKSSSEIWVKMSDVQLGRVENENINGGWRKEVPLNYSPMDSLKCLSKPFNIHLDDGVITGGDVPKDEPTWCVNIWRGLVSQFSLRMANLRPENPEQAFFFVDDEPSVGGLCRSHYTVAPLPEYVAESYEDSVPRDIVKDKRPFVLTKTKDFSKCSMKPVYLHDSITDLMDEGSDMSDSSYKRLSSRTAVSRCLLRGNPLKEEFTIEKIWSESEFSVKPFAAKAEMMLAVTNQTLVLKRMEPIRQPIPEQPGMKTVSVVHDLFAVDQPRPSQSDFRRFPRPEMTMSRTPEWIPSLDERPRLEASSGTTEVPVEAIKEEIRMLLDEMEEDCSKLENLADRFPGMKMDKMARAFQSFNTMEIEKIFMELVGPKRESMDPKMVTKRSLLLDTIAFCGTNPCMMFLTKMIKEREVIGESASQLMMMMPAVVKTPTPELFDHLMDLVKVVKPEERQWHTALLSVSNLMYRACVIPTRLNRDNFFCTPEVTRPFLEYLKKEMEMTNNPSTWMVLIQAIGNLGTPEVFHVLKPIISGKMTTESQVRSKAIFALREVTRIKDEALMQEIRMLLKPIFNNRHEPHDVRISAFIGLLYSKADGALFSEIATGTWFERSNQVGHFVYSTLENLANSTYPSHRDLSRKATVVLPLTKPFKLGMQYSKNLIFPYMTTSKDSGSFFQYSQMGNKNSLFPTMMYFNTRRHLGGMDMPMLQLCLQTQGMQTLLNRLFGPWDREPLPNFGVDIEPLKEKPWLGTLWLRMMGNMERVITLDIFKDWAKSGIVEVKDNRWMINYQKMIPLIDKEVLFPSESGLPVYMVIKAPLIASIKGSVELHLGKNEINFRKMDFPKEILLKGDIKPGMSLNMMTEVGVACPFSQKVYVTGHNSHVVMAMPRDVEVKYNGENKELEITALRPKNLPEQVEIFGFRSFPFTGSCKFFEFKKKDLAEIRTQERPQIYETVIGKKVGVWIEVFQKLDKPFGDFSGIYDLVKPFNIWSVMDMMMVPHTLREVEYKLNLNVKNTETQAMKAVFKFGNPTTTMSLLEMNLNPSMKLSEDDIHDVDFNIKTDTYSYPSQPLNVRKMEDRAAVERMMDKSMFIRDSKSNSLEAEVTFVGPNPRHFRGKFSWVWSPYGRKQKILLMLEKERSPDSDSFKLCLKTDMTYPKLPLKRTEILEAPLSAMGHLVTGFGKDCSERSLEARWTLTRSEEQKNVARTSPNARLCLTHENEEHRPYSPACMRARMDATELNLMKLDIEGHNLPRTMLNISHHVDDFLKYYWYKYMSNRRLEVENPKNRVRVVTEVMPMTPSRPWKVVNIKMEKPEETTIFRHMKLGWFLENMLPWSAKTPMKERFMRNTMGNNYIPTCKIQEDWVRTFDNVSFKHPMSDCFHLITKDCSMLIPVEVWARKTGNGKMVKINLSKMVVEVGPEPSVRVDGKEVVVPQGKEVVLPDSDNRETLIVRKPYDEEVEVWAPIHGVRVRSDGRIFSVAMSNRYRSHLCGICGDMNGEMDKEFRDPKGCIRMDPREFAASFSQSSCRPPIPEPPKNCMKANAFVEHEPSLLGQVEKRMMVEVPPTEVTEITYHEELICFSVKPVPMCPVGYRPLRFKPMKVGFHCIPRGRFADSMIARASREFVEEMRGKTVDLKELVSTPQACERIQL